MVLVYLDSRSLKRNIRNNQEYYLQQYSFESLRSCKPYNYTKPIEALFDHILFTGYAWNYQACFWPGVCKRPLNITDNEEIFDLWYQMGVLNLDAATSKLSQDLPEINQTGVFITIPYPDVRQTKFGIINGRMLNFSVPEDRIAAAQWWIDKWVSTFENQSFKYLSLRGFYWYLEDVSSEYDVGVLQEISKYLHQKKMIFNWIPSYQGSSNISIWKDVGFDFVTQQPNYAFYNVTVERFKNTSQLMYDYNLGVEMELGLASRNPLINYNQTLSFYQYLEAALQYNWMNGTLKTYYNGNDFLFMSQSGNITLQQQYRDICAFVNQRYKLPVQEKNISVQ